MSDNGEDTRHSLQQELEVQVKDVEHALAEIRFLIGELARVAQ